MKDKIIRLADLFCGAGGTSTGALDAIELMGRKCELTAVNHWDRAIETHKANHPKAIHLLSAIDNVNPRDHFTEGELDLLWASPECTHHSVARGGRPINEQSRATAWCVIRWADALQPPVILVENVPEFVSWGGIGTNGRPLKGKKGKTFMAWVSSLESLGYRVDWRVLCAADYGDPTTRKRMFVMAVRGRRKIVWPEPTHCDAKLLSKKDFFSIRKPWVAAREIIDWSLEGTSIFNRKRPLSDKTMRRIMKGLEKFGLKPFIVPQNGEHVRSADEPLPTVTTTSRGMGMAKPFIIGAGGPRGSSRPQSVEKPLGTVLAEDRRGIVEPFLLKFRGTTDTHLNGSAQSLDEPVPAIATAQKFGIAAPFIVGIDHHGGNGDQLRPVDEPLSTISTKARHAVAEPYLVQVAHGNGADKNGDERRAQSIDRPMPTVCGNRGETALCVPSLLPQHGGGALRSTEQPTPTVATDGAIALVEPFLVKYFGTGIAKGVGEPLDSVTTKERFGLAAPSVNRQSGSDRPVVMIGNERYYLDIRFRMLQPHELSAAQGFRPDYQFAGNKTEQVKLIGNAVPRRLARALVLSAMSQQSDISGFIGSDEA